MERITPINAIDGIKEQPVEVMMRFAELAAALGADLQTPAITAARKRFEDARSALRAAVAAKLGLLAVALYASPTEGISFCRPATFPGLSRAGTSSSSAGPASSPTRSPARPCSACRLHATG